MKRLDDRAFYEMLRVEEHEILQDIMTDAIKTFLQNVYESLKNEMKETGSKLIFLGAFKKLNSVLPLDVVYDENIYPHAKAFEEAIDKIIKKLKKKRDIENIDVETYDSWNKIEFACLLIEGNVGMVEIYQNTVSKYEQSCKKDCGIKEPKIRKKRKKNIPLKDLLF